MSAGLSFAFITESSSSLEGFVPALFMIESVMHHLAESLQMDPDSLKLLNMYQQGDRSYIVWNIYNSRNV